MKWRCAAYRAVMPYGRQHHRKYDAALKYHKPPRAKAGPYSHQAAIIEKTVKDIMPSAASRRHEPAVAEVAKEAHAGVNFVTRPRRLAAKIEYLIYVAAAQRKMLAGRSTSAKNRNFARRGESREAGGRLFR